MIRVKCKIQLTQEFLQEYPDLDLKKLPTWLEGSHLLNYENGDVASRATYEGYALSRRSGSPTGGTQLLKFVRSDVYNHSTVLEVGEVLG